MLGVLLRVLRFAQDWPLWWNEAFVAVNLFDRDYTGLLRPLAYRQVCPVGFLWAERLVLDLLGASTWSLRLLPFLAGLAALGVLTVTASRLRPARAGLVALALLAIAYHPIRLGAELKPYSLDLLAAAIVLDRALAWRSDRDRPAPFLHLAVLTFPLMLLSYPAALVLAGTAAALVLDWRRASPRARVAWAVWLLTIVAAAVVVRGLAAGQAAAAQSDPLNEYLRDGFPASWSPRDLVRWLTDLAFGRLFAFPFGDAGVPSLLGLSFASLGLATVARRDLSLALLLIGPFAASLAAALLRLYPLGGHPRVDQHLLPSLALALGYGLDAATTRLPVPAPRWGRLARAGLVLLGIVPLLRDAAHPYRTARDLAARDFARSFWPETARDARIVCLRRDLRLFPTDDANPDVALYLANRVLYEPRDSASPPGPVRYVHYDAPGLASDALQPWLDSRRLVSWVIHDLPHHGDRGGRVRVFQQERDTPPAPGTARAEPIESSRRR